MASASLRSSSSVTGAGSTTAVFTKPTGLAVGDCILAIIGHAIAISAVPTGFSLVLTDSGHSKVSAYFKVADSSDVAASNFTFTFSSSSVRVGVMAAIQDSDTTDPIGSSDSTVTDNDAFDPITPTRAQSIYLVFSEGAAARTFSGYEFGTDNPSWTELFDGRFDGTTAVCMGVAWATRAATSNTGNINIVSSGTLNSRCSGVIEIMTQPVNLTVTPSVVTAAFSIQSPSVSGAANVSPAVVGATFSVQAPTVSTPAADWVNPDKSAAPSWVNPDKS